MAALATTADVAARWRTLTAAETTVAATLLDDASAIVRARVTDVDARITASSDYGALVVATVSGMVLRVLRNPEGKVQEAIDDYSYRRADSTAEGLLYLDARELAELTASSGPQGAFTIRPAYTA